MNDVERRYYPGRNHPCNRATGDHATRQEPHEPHEWNADLGDEGYECWGYPIPAQQPEQFRIYRR